MSTILFASLLASTVAADITTSIWLPGSANANQTLLGSIIQQNGENTIMSLAFQSSPSAPDFYQSAPERVTVAGTTRVAYKVSASDSAASNSAPSITVALECSRPNEGVSAVPTCTVSTIGAAQGLSAVCEGLTVASLPDYCTDSDAQTFDQTMTFNGESQYMINNFNLIITAGTEKLSASAAGTPRSLSASATSTGTSNGLIASGTPSGASGSLTQSTGAAFPMKTVSPALAGLGAVAAALIM